jgi:hypothetical protein
MKHPVFFIALFLVLLTCQAYPDTFENGPGGMRVDYTITGLSLSAPQDREVSADVLKTDYRHIRDYQITRIGSSVTFSGTASFANASSELPAKLTVAIWYMDANDDSADVPELEQKGMAKSYTKLITTSQSEPFSLTVKTPQGYKVGIELLLTRNVHAGVYPVGYTDIPQYHLRISGRSSDAPEWTTVVEPQGPTTTVIPHNTTSIDDDKKPPDIGGYVLTAALAAAVAAIIAAAAIGGAAVKTGSKKPDDKPLAYILQLSADTIKLNPEKPASLRITAWKVNSETKSCVRAPEASLTVLVNPDAKGLIVAPLAGKEDLTVSLSIDRQAAITETELTVTAQAGVSSTSAAVKVIVEQGIEMEFF